jgi:hypothetical protein
MSSGNRKSVAIGFVINSGGVRREWDHGVCV